MHVIPAHPGWFVLLPLVGEDSEVVDVRKEPVIAWGIEIDGDRLYPSPVITDADQDTDVLLLPDGRVRIALGDEDFDSLVEAMPALRNRWKE